MVQKTAKNRDCGIRGQQNIMFMLYCPRQQFCYVTLLNAWNLLAPHWKTRTDAPGHSERPPPPRWQTVENDWTNITWPISVLCDHINATIETLWRVFWMYSNCARLLQSIPDTIICGGSRSCFSALFPMFPTCFLCGFRQSETGQIDYSQFPRWRQQAGSSYAVHNCTSETWFFDRFRLPQTCTMWISPKTEMSNNCGSYENHSYLSCLLTDLEKVDCCEIGQCPSCVFQDGCREPEWSLRGLSPFVSMSI